MTVSRSGELRTVSIASASAVASAIAEAAMVPLVTAPRGEPPELVPTLIFFAHADADADADAAEIYAQIPA